MSQKKKRKRKKKKFGAVSTVKELARERIGTPPPGQVVPNRKRKREAGDKHRPTLGQLLEPDE
jgi:hypothetical protein